MNLKLEKKDELIKKLERKNIPLVAFLELTNECDLNCIHCMSLKKTSKNLQFSDYKRIISELESVGVLNLVFTGGEPLLNKDFFNIAKYAKEIGFNIKVSSNVNKIDAVNVVLLEKLKPITFQVSVYGATSMTHDAITGVDGSYDSSLRAIGILKEKGIKVKVHMIVMRKNFNELEKLQEKAKILNIDFSYDFILYPSHNGSITPLSLRITDEQLNLARNNGLINEETFIEKSITTDRIIRKQGIAGISCRVSASGEVFASGTLRLGLGNLKTSTFGDIWFNSSEVKALRELADSDFECFKCRHAGRCLWDVGLAYAEHKSLTATPKEWCRFIKKRGKL